MTPQHRAQLAAFVDVFVPPLPAPVVASKPLRLPPTVTAELKVETHPAEIEPLAVPEKSIARLEPPPAPEPRRDAPVPERPRAAPVVTVGAFAPAGESHNAVEQYRVLQAAGFDAPAARSPQIAAATTAVGAFEQSAAQGRVQVGTDRPNVVGDAGFGGNNLTAGPPRQAGRVSDAGFGSGAAAGSVGRPGGRGVVAAGFESGSGAPATVASSPSVVKASDFDTRAAQRATPQAVRQPPTEKALEILAKPTPVYTDEARALHIEGEVLLDVEFTATGEIHVLKVVRGLGYGLDESAARAVQAMRFKPAQRNGQPVDFQTVVNIVFRLA